MGALGDTCLPPFGLEKVTVFWGRRGTQNQAPHLWPTPPQAG